MQKKKSENTLTTEPILQTIQTVPIWSRAECSIIVGLDQGRPTRGPRAIFGPHELLKWPSRTSLSDSDNIKLAILAKIAEVWPSKEFLSKIWPPELF